MPTVKELIRSGRREDLWQMCCGFLDLNLEQFMAIQKRLLIEQIELLNNSIIGRKIMKGQYPLSVDDFRRLAPLTTYADYCPELSEKHEDVLPVKPLFWQHTSGRSTEYPFKWESIKWMPVTPRFFQEMGIVSAACAILSSCKRKGDVSAIKPGSTYIYAVAPRPYTSGTFAYIVSEEVTGTSLPPLELAEKLPFEERIQLSFKQALSKGCDFYFGISVALVAISEKMNQQMGKMDIRPLITQPRALFRVIRGLIKSKLAGRKLLPKDLWNIRGILGSGTDADIFRDVIKNAWGRYPFNLYGSTEAGIVAMQTWDYKDMVFIPSGNFLEFIPQKEYSKWQSDNSYEPQTILMDEVIPGEKYELVITNFHGGPLSRYRTGDIFKIASLSNEKLSINLPQIEFDGRVDDVMDIGGFVRLTEKVIWQAVSNTAIPYVDWVARKEFSGNIPILHLYVELKTDAAWDERKMAEAVYSQLKKMDEDFLYGDVESVLNTMPIKVSFLPAGAFVNYIAFRRAQGADLAHLKPHHINPSDKELATLGTKVQTVPGAIGIPVGVSPGK
ncbi:MAG: GH3 auxin-responsive promoter family protein [Chloroflexi bacterium]|nr:GH3 auxin-responsive promoter family protein [Chloroflexota bacterium]